MAGLTMHKKWYAAGTLFSIGNEDDSVVDTRELR